MRRRIVCCLAMAVATAFCWLRSYEVLPTKASWSGWAPEEGYVGQVFTANFDSICEVSLFTGSPGAGQNYNLEVRDAETNDLVAYQYNVAPAGDHTWLRFMNIVPDGKFIRGRLYLAKFTRPGDSVNYYYGDAGGGGPYKYGYMVVPGQQPPILSQDLCCRIYGLARVGAEFSVHSNIAYDQGLSDSANWDDCIRREREVGVRHDKVGFATGWGFVQPAKDSWNWGWLDYLITRYANRGVQPYVSFTGNPGWAASAECYIEIDSINHDSAWVPDGACLPSNLFANVRSGDTVNSDNYYAKYIYEFMKRYGPIGYSYDNTAAGTFWREHTQLPSYVPVTICEGRSAGHFPDFF